MSDYFSEREVGSRPRIEREIPNNVWGGIVSLVESLISNGSFGLDFPEECHDSSVTVGTHRRLMESAIGAEFPDIVWPLWRGTQPPTLVILDFIEFCHRHVAQPIQIRYHNFFQHYHLNFDRESGQSEFREAINRIFSRNGLAYELQSNGQIQRIATPVLDESLRATVFQTGDSVLNSMLEDARKKFLDPDDRVHKESLEKLWDAWERLKTLVNTDKKSGIQILLEKASPEERFRSELEKEARTMTEIGNRFQIRHSEVNQIPLTLPEHVDYLFHRLFALITLILRRKNS